MTGPLPARFGRYEVLGLLGQGGMGAVYKAQDPELDRVVALKTINPVLLGAADRDEFLARFRREARAAGRLSHPNIVSVFDLGVDEATGTPFIVMEYVAGVSLEAVLKENPKLPLGQALEIVAQVGAALEEAHRHGVIHRDIKPANVYLDDRGRVKVGDFGVARIEGSELTQTGISLGTPGYTAPEILRGGVADARTDVFALGVLAYRVLTGTRPFRGATPEVTVYEVVSRDPDPPRALRPEVSDHASGAVMHALAKSPEERTPSAEAFVEELTGKAPVTKIVPVPPPAAAVAPTPVAPSPSHDTVVVLDPPWYRRRRGLALAAVAAAAALLVLMGALLARSMKDPDQAAAEPSPAAGPVASTLAPRRTVTPRTLAPEPPLIAAPPPAGGRSRSEPDGEGRGQSDEVAREAGRKAEELAREAQKKLEEILQKAAEKSKDERGKGKGRGKKDKDRE